MHVISMYISLRIQGPKRPDMAKIFFFKHTRLNAQKKQRKFRTDKSIRETNQSLDSCNSCRWTAWPQPFNMRCPLTCVKNLKLQFVSCIEFIRSKLSFSCISLYSTWGIVFDWTCPQTENKERFLSIMWDCADFTKGIVVSLYSPPTDDSERIGNASQSQRVDVLDHLLIWLGKSFVTFQRRRFTKGYRFDRTINLKNPR